VSGGTDDDRSESDVADDDKVASSRAGGAGGTEDKDGDGSYVGRSFNDDALDAGETGAEARSQER
jgi:hypothetical protein